MAGSTSPIFTDLANNGVAKFENADGTTKKTIFTPGADGGRVDRILVTSDDTAARTLQFFVTRSAVDYHLCDVLIPIGTGYDAVVGVDALPSILRNLNTTLGLTLPTGDVLKAAAKVAVTSAKVITVAAIGGDY